MTFPIVEGTNESANTATAATIDVSLPASIAAGELLLVVVAKGGSGTAAGVNAETGWTELVDEAVLRGAFVAYRQADGGEGATVQFDTSQVNRSAHMAFRISGAEAVGTQPPEISAVATGTSAAPDSNTCTPTGGAKDYLWLTFFTQAGEEADDDTWVNNAATNYGNLMQKTSGIGGTNVGANLGLSRRENNAASEDAVWPAASTDQSLAWRAFTIAIHPAAAPAEDPRPTRLIVAPSLAAVQASRW
ncbi:MAG: hypothetical protein ACRD0W_06535 [Acidimicrobiales bacterium]